MSMLPKPNELSGIDVNVRRFSNLLQKEFATQGLRNKSTQKIRMKSTNCCGQHTIWMKTLISDKSERQYVIDCVNEQLVTSGWQITGTTVETDRGSARRLYASLKYRAVCE